MRPLLVTLAALAVTAAALCAPAAARIQDDMLCYEPDFEWPVPCDDEE